MDLKALEYFVRVAELGSFTQAEQALSVPQPTLSKHVRALEVEVQQALFDRTGRGVVLTEAGRQLLAHAHGILTQVERARRDLISGSGVLTGDCVVGFPSGVGRALTVALVRECRRQLPDARLVLYELLSTHVLEQVAEGRIDIGLAHNPRPAAAYEMTRLISEKLYLIGPAGGALGRGPVTVAELERYPFVVHSDRQTRRSLIASDIANAKIDLKIVSEVGSTEAILDLVQAGMGYAVLPVSVLRHRVDQFALRPIAEPTLETTLWLLTTKRRPLTQLALRVIDIIKGAVELSVNQE